MEVACLRLTILAAQLLRATSINSIADKIFMSRIIVWKKKNKIILLIAILAFLGAVYAVVRKKPLPPSDFQEEKTSTGIAIPNEVHVYNGLVEELGEEYLVMRSESGNNYLAADSTVRVSFDDKTKFVKKSAPTVVSPSAKFITVVEETASAKDIILGATVVVYSSDNIKGDLEFLAERVIIIDNF